MYKHDVEAGENRAARKIEGKPYDTVPDWEQIGTFGVGLAIGAVIGAATALLMAPASGEATRARLGSRIRGIGRDDSVWDELGDELKHAASRLKRGEVEEVEELEPV